MKAEVAHGLVDAEGRLAEAEDALLGLSMRAGGGLGQPFGVPQIATVARLARRLQVPIARNVVVADHEADIELFVRARPEGETVRLAVAGWRERPAWRPSDERAQADLAVTAADWSWRCDGALRLRLISEEGSRRHGFDAASLLGRSLTDLFSIEANDGKLPILQALAERRSFTLQPATVRADGSAVLLSAVARHGPDGAFTGFAGSVSLVDGPTRGESTSSVTIGMGDRLERVLRAPLSRIIANADSIHAGAEGPVASDYAGYAADIAGAGRHLLAVIDDLADLEAIEQPDFTPEMEPIDLADLARRASGLLSVRAANSGVTIVRPAVEARAPAIGDFRRVLQILVNLIGNAVRYSPVQGQVVVDVGPGATIIVSDAGKGIAREDQSRIFSKFERVDAMEPGGSGLGLYIARRLARAMGGDLSVDSAPGEGARFTFNLAPDASSGQDQHQA